jgi:DNA-binding winged helix-turn-helix (wHTH) protein/TolB-like protein
MTPKFDKVPLVSRIYRFGGFELDEIDETLKRGSEVININRRMFEVLRLLIRNAGRVVSKDEFFRDVWGGRFVEDNNLTVTITALRKVLGDSAKEARFIENLPRKGYRFVADVESSADNFPFAEPVTSETVHIARREVAHSAPSVRRFKFSRIAAVTAFLILTVTVAVIAYRGFVQKSPLPPNGPISIAIMPFESGDPTNEYLAIGLSDDLQSDMTRSADLRPIGRYSISVVKAKASDPNTVADELKTQAILSGKIESSGNALTVSVELFDAAANAVRFQKRFRTDRANLAFTKNDILKSVEEYLTGKRQTFRTRHEAVDQVGPDAYDHYLKGRYYLSKRSNPYYFMAFEQFKAAIDLNPTFAKAYVGLADTYTLGGLPELRLARSEQVALARTAAFKALEIDPNLGEAYSSIAINKSYYDWDIDGAIDNYRRAAELNPNDATTHHWYAETLSMKGMFDESLKEYQAALALDPSSPSLRADMAFMYYYHRDYDKAIDLLKQLTIIDPGFFRAFEFLVQAYRAKGMYAEAIEAEENRIGLELKQMHITQEEFDRLSIYVANLKRGLKNGGSKGYWQAERSYGLGVPYYLAVANAQLEDKDAAFAYLSRLIEERFSGIVWINVTPELDPIRSDPRFAELVKKAGL